MSFPFHICSEPAACYTPLNASAWKGLHVGEAGRECIFCRQTILYKGLKVSVGLRAPRQGVVAWSDKQTQTGHRTEQSDH
jgi:hypothetical protein